MTLKILWFVLAISLIAIGLSETQRGYLGWGLFTLLVAGLCLGNGLHED